MPWSERVVDGACFVFAVWTVACQATVALGGSLWLALGVFVAAGLIVLGGLSYVRRAAVGAQPRSPGSPEGASGPAPPDPEARASGVPRGVRIGGLVLAISAAIFLRESPVALWWLGLGVLGVAGSLSLFREPLRDAPPASGSRREGLLWVLALLAVAVALVAHRPDLDDSFYLNLAVASADAPGDPLLAGDTLHGVPGLPLHHPVYRVHTWEVWNAAISRLTGIPVAAVFHFVSASLVALLVPLAWARLFRRLVPRHWLWAVAAVLWVLVIAGDAHRWYGNFAFVRIWQGKSVFLSVLLPVIWSAGLDFARRPSTRGFLLLGAAQVAALGCTSTAVWAGPAAALSAAACALPSVRYAWRRLGATVLASAYVLILGLGVQQSVFQDREARLTAGPDAIVAERIERKRLLVDQRHAPGTQLARSLDLVTGAGLLQAVCIAAVLGAWALAPRGLGRRFACGVPLAVWALLLNPYFSSELARFAIGGSHWRALWVLPIPALLALLLTAPLELSRRRLVAVPITLAAFAAFGIVPAHSALSPANGVSLRSPGLKFPVEEHALARAFSSRLPAGSVVVAPRRIAAWLPTFHDRVHPILARDAYLVGFRTQLGGQNVALRVLMTDFVSGRGDEPDAARHFVRGLQRFGVDAVLVVARPETQVTRKTLREVGFEHVGGTEIQVWERR